MSTPRKPNILLITTDQQRGDALGINGNRFLETPNLDSLAAGGVNFRRAYSTCPVCIPARRSLISGQSAEKHGMRGYREGVEFNPPATLPGCLRDAGYQTQLIGKLHLHPQGKRFGFDNIKLSESSNWRPDCEWQKRNDYVTWLRDQGVTRDPHAHGIGSNSRLARSWQLDEALHVNNWMTETAVRFLKEERDPSTPVFLHLSFFHPHPPFVPLDSYFQRYLAKDLPAPVPGEWAPAAGQGASLRHPEAWAGPFEPDVMRRATAAYYALINHIDDCVAHVLERFRTYGSPGEHDPMYVLFSSDHGEMLGDHHLFRKSFAYEASTRVPFFIGGHNVPMRRGVSDQLVCWEDIAPTLLDLAGVEIPDSMDGRSLAPLVRGESGPEPRAFLFGQCETMAHNLWVTTDRWKYIWYPKTNEEQMFDLIADPNENRDVSANAEVDADKAHLRTLLTQSLAHRTDLSFDPATVKACANRPPKALWG